MTTEHEKTENPVVVEVQKLQPKSKELKKIDKKKAAKKNGQATGKAVEKTTENGRQTVKAKTSARSERGYKNHISGSRKEQVHHTYDDKGVDKAREFGLKMGLKPSTLTSWFGTWKREVSVSKA